MSTRQRSFRVIGAVVDVEFPRESDPARFTTR